MLKHKRKANKAALIANSRAYGEILPYQGYNVFPWLAQVHGKAKAAAMIADVVTRGIYHNEWVNYPAGFVIWADTNYTPEWKEADNHAVANKLSA